VGSVPGQHQSQSGGHTPDDTSKTILVVEDDLAILETLKAFFEIMSIEAHYASSGAQAQKLVDQLTYPLSLVLVDGWLPDTHGVKLIESFRLRNRQVIDARTAVYLFSADSDLNLSKLPRELGITGIVRKPFEPDYLVELAQKYARILTDVPGLPGLTRSVDQDDSPQALELRPAPVHQKS
jgi:DNA-binding response OmpR family regulator